MPLRSVLLTEEVFITIFFRRSTRVTRAFSGDSYIVSNYPPEKYWQNQGGKQQLDPSHIAPICVMYSH